MSKSSSQIKKDADAAHAKAAHEGEEAGRAMQGAVDEATASAKAQGEAAKEYGLEADAIKRSSELDGRASFTEMTGNKAEAARLRAESQRVMEEARQHHNAAVQQGQEAARHDAEFKRLTEEGTRHTEEAARIEHDAHDLDGQRVAAQAAEQRYAEAQAERPHAGTQKETDLSAAQAEQARAEAVAARQAAADGYEHRAKDIAEARDEAALSAAAADQGARAAQMQVKHEERMVADAKAHADHLSHSADAVAKSNPALAESYREQAAAAGVDLRVAQTRLDSAHQRAAAQAELAKQEHDSVQTLEKQYQDLQTQRASAEKAVDGMEERARLLEQAKQKLADAETNHDPKLQAEAQALVDQAQRIHVDADAVAKVAPPADAQPTDAQPTGSDTQGPVTHPDSQDASPTATDPQDQGPVTHPDQSAGDPGTPPPDTTAHPTAGTPTTEELRTMATEYSNAAQSVHKERVDLARTTSTSDHDRDVQLEIKGTKGEIEMVESHTKMYRDQLTELQTHATQLQNEAEQLFRHGKSTEAEEKQEEADVATAQVDRTAGLIKDREEKLTELKTKAESLDHEWKASRAAAADDQVRGEQLEKTADKLDDVARGVGDAYRARLDADDLRVRAAQPGIDAQQKAQLEQQAQAKEAEATRLLTQAQQQVPADDDVARKALQDAGVPAPQPAPAESTPAAPSDATPAGTPAPAATGTDASATPVPMDATSMDEHDGVAAAHPAADADAVTGQSAGAADPAAQPAAADVASTPADVTGVDAHGPGSTTTPDDASSGTPPATPDSGTPVQVADAGGSGLSGDAAATHGDVVGIDSHDSAAVPASDLEAGQPVAMDHEADAGGVQAAPAASDDFNHVDPVHTDAGQVEPQQEFHDDQQVADATPPADSYDSFAVAHADAAMDTGSSDDDGDYA